MHTEHLFSCKLQRSSTQQQRIILTFPSTDASAANEPAATLHHHTHSLTLMLALTTAPRTSSSPLSPIIQVPPVESYQSALPANQSSLHISEGTNHLSLDYCEKEMEMRNNKPMKEIFGDDSMPPLPPWTILGHHVAQKFTQGENTKKCKNYIGIMQVQWGNGAMLVVVCV